MAKTAEHDGSALTPSTPFPISCITAGKSKRYMLFDIDLITWLRREHHILGVLIGSLPQAPSQNVFLGLPLELMPEEARLLCEKGLAFVTNDRAGHMHSVQNGADRSQVDAYQTELRERGLAMAESVRRAKEIKLEEVMKRLSLTGDTPTKSKQKAKPKIQADKADSLFEQDESTTTVETTEASITRPPLDPYTITPMTAGPLQSSRKSSSLPEVDPSSYVLFKLLHSQNYFLSPGLRFGCQYMAYPGDPLRYHSHFLTVGKDWDKGIDLVDIIGGGRLATGVKKSFLLGGMEPGEDGETRAFSIEWAGM